MKGVSLIANLFQRKKNINLNEFLNIQRIEKNYLYTLDEQVILFLKVHPINIDLLTEEEKEAKMELMNIELSSESYQYKILVIPRAVDITDHIREQINLKDMANDDVSINIINNRIISTTKMIENKNITENEFYIMIYEKSKENVEVELNKRASNWIGKLKNSGYDSRILSKRDIILLVKSFTIPEFARVEGTDYSDNIVRIKREDFNVKNK